jgi:mono/diheme cytochrome c family protein
MRILIPALRLCCLLGLLPGYAVAQTEAGDPAEGQRLAQTWCSNCHLVDPQGQSRASDATPSFAAIARMPSTTPLSLHAFLVTPHPPMPDFRLSRTQIEDLTAYILTLRRK